LKWFHIDVTLEMRTVLYGMRLFNDNISKHEHHIYMKRKEGGREQNSGETERECVRDEHGMAERGGSISCKMGHWRNVMSKLRIGLRA
jgi:hypothetical protein